MKIKDTGFISEGFPQKTGIYKVRFCRAKSKQVHEGTAQFSKTRKTWEDILGSRGYVNDSWDSRDSRIVSPKVIAWMPCN